MFVDKVRRWLGAGVNMDRRKSSRNMETTRYERLNIVCEKRTVRWEVSPTLSKADGLRVRRSGSKICKWRVLGVVATNTVVVTGGLSLVVMFGRVVLRLFDLVMMGLIVAVLRMAPLIVQIWARSGFDDIEGFFR
nr:hypothetical protein [Tanacetum cinerariifolium]